MSRKLYVAGRVILSWMVANLLGVAAIGALSFFFPFLKSIPGRLVSSLMIGVPIGLAQWIALRRVAPISILWALTISAGLILGLEAGPIFSGIWGNLDDESVIAMTFFCTTIGFLVGLVQWIFLWGYFSKSAFWLLGSAVGLGLGICLILVSNLIDQSGIVSIILVTLIYALVTGLVISWLHPSRRKEESNLVNAI